MTGRIARVVRRYWLRAVVVTFLVAGFVVISFPLYWMAVSAVLPADRLYVQSAPLVPTDVTLANVRALFHHDRFVLFYFNSILLSTGVVGLTTVTATLGGYALASVTFRFKRTFTRMVLLGYVFPPILLAIPMYTLWRGVGLLNSRVGVVLGVTATSLPFSLWLMWQYFQTIPDSLGESAQVVGAARFRAFYEIELPLAKPGLIAVATFSYAVAWNAYTIPKVVLTDASKWPLTVGIHDLVVNNKVLWPEVMAGSALTILPALVFVYFLQTYLLEGFSGVGLD